MATQPDPGTARIGLGLAAVGRPAYINVGRDRDLPAERSVDTMRRITHELLDSAYSWGIRSIDTARSYGRAEEFLADWLNGRDDIHDLTVSSKWGYTYTADWAMDAETHEVKEHSTEAFERQLEQTRRLLGNWLSLYQVHSVTPDSPLFSDTALQRRLAALAADGVTVGMSTSGPRQADAIRAALELEVDGEPLILSVQTTWNVLEPSAGDALAEAHAAGRRVIVKEALANGRLVQGDPGTAFAAVAHETQVSPDAVALAAALHQPWAHTVLSGAATTEQLASNLQATRVRLTEDQLARLAGSAEPPTAYWAHRSELPWA
ncbi:aldo/keto reductase [Wenjunlia tyrosinilytica]|uniref:Oxidoreductase n=1 Tax=Wenjunlia tyrosinilytica TaxID=1544741 RepID=A0A917ZRH3_9ACTN|nr:aldo/keto reductase [Wenjunlia tyrosinilytica]GGO89934.1 oxidoreductase [Wenjunlia tyrosinilytica]